MDTQGYRTINRCNDASKENIINPRDLNIISGEGKYSPVIEVKPLFKQLYLQSLIDAAKQLNILLEAFNPLNGTIYFVLQCNYQRVLRKAAHNKLIED